MLTVAQHTRDVHAIWYNIGSASQMIDQQWSVALVTGLDQ